MRARRWVCRSLAVGALTVAAAATGAAGASAHVLVDTTTPNGDGTTTITFTFDHGCSGEPTSGLEVTLPPGVTAAGTHDPDGWSATITDDTVAWTGELIADGEVREFGLVATVAGEPGQAFIFPTVQTCAGGGSYQWTDPSPSSNAPAPTFIATAATLTSRPSAAPAAAQGERAGGAGGATLPQALGAVALLTVGAFGGSIALDRRRSPRTPRSRSN